MAINSDPHYSPIGVFDAGIGSYAVVEKLHQKYPKQDLIYLADRRSFPYGDKSFCSGTEQSWQMKREMLSPRYKTYFSELLTVK